jgi:KipI family sensor histidine kinase inhibitor
MNYFITDDTTLERILLLVSGLLVIKPGLTTDIIGFALAGYLIYMLGFTPGFPYLGDMDERIATPRLATPRTKNHAGMVGIAASQTGIYLIESPGGWQLIGRTP